MVTGVGGYLLWGRFGSRGGVSAEINLTDKMRSAAYAICSLSALAILSGVALLSTSHRKEVVIVRPKTTSIDNARSARVLTGAASASVAICVVAMGLDGILWRASYLGYEHGNQTFLRVSGITILAGAAAASSLTKFAAPRARLFGWLCFGAIVALLISQGSRRLALMPFLLLLGGVALGRSPSKRAISLSVALALYIVRWPLAFRALPQHGLIPHVQSIPALMFGEFPWAPILSNLLFGFPVAAYVAFVAPRLPLSAYWISVDPRTGEAAGFYKMYTTLQINTFTPYSALGQLANHGTLLLVGYSLLLGIVLTGCGRSLVGLSSGARGASPLRRLFLAASSAYIGLNFVQYTLRSTTRVVYLLIFVAVGSQVYKKRAEEPIKR